MTKADGEDETLLERLRYGCPLPIHEVEESTALRLGHVYCNVSGGALCVREGRVFVPHVRSVAGSALLSSALTVYGEQTVAILLGGTLESAAAEARKVVWAGGSVFAHQIDEEPAPLIRNGVARAYKSIENLAEAIGVVCSGLRRAV